MTVRNLATLDRTVFQPLGRLLQEAFADGLIATGSISREKTVATAQVASFANGVYLFKSTLTGIGGTVHFANAMFHVDITSAFTSGVVTAMKVLVECTGADPDLSGLSWVTAAEWGWNLSKAGACAAGLTNPCVARYWHRYSVYAGIDPPTHFLYANSAMMFGGHYATNQPVSQIGDAMIPIKLGGNTYYLVGFEHDGLD